MNRKSIIIFLILLAAASTQVDVYADIPSTLSITRRSEGGNLLIDVRVRHADPTPSHYIAQINVDLDGTVKSFTDLTKATSVEATYTVNLGPVSPKLIKAQAVCNTHGPGGYLSETGGGGSAGGGGIPAYPNESIIAGIGLGVAAIVILTKFRPVN